MEKFEHRKLQEAIAYVKENIDYPFERIAQYLEGNKRDYHIGYVRVGSLFESFGIPKYKIISEEKSYQLLDRQDDNDEDNFHCLVYQEAMFEDCFSGYLLFPLKDGRYWMLSYEC